VGCPSRVRDALRGDVAAEDDEVFRALLPARIIEPTSEADSLWVLEEAGTGAPSYRTVIRRLSVHARPEWRQRARRTPGWDGRRCAV
jgi:hypothetical protein